MPGTPAPVPESEGTVEKPEKEGKLGKGKLFLKSKGRSMSWGSGVGSPLPSPSPSPGPEAEGRRKKSKEPYSLEAGNDIVGIVMLEIQSVEDLPKLRNSMCPLFPFTVAQLTPFTRVQ